MLKDHCEYSSWLVRMIEGDIKDSWMYDLSDEAKDKCLLSIRKNLINEMVLSHQEKCPQPIGDIRAGRAWQHNDLGPFRINL